MGSRWLPLMLRGLIAILVMAVIAIGWYVIQTAFTKPAVPRTAAERTIMDGEDAVKSDPNSADARLLLAEGYAGAGQYANAVKQLEIAIKIDPKNVRAHYVLGSVHKDQGRFDEAITALKKAASLKGESGDVYGDIYYELGSAYMAKNDFKNAVEAFTEGENYSMALYMLKDKAIAYEKLGAKEDAKLTYLNILARDVENKEAMASLKRLGVSQSIINETIRSGR